MDKIPIEFIKLAAVHFMTEVERDKGKGFHPILRSYNYLKKQAEKYPEKILCQLDMIKFTVPDGNDMDNVAEFVKRIDLLALSMKKIRNQGYNDGIQEIANHARDILKINNYYEEEK